MPKIVFKIDMKIDGVIARIRSIQKDLEQSTREEGLDRIGRKHVIFLRKRYRKMSAGGGEWPDLAQETKDSKRSRKIATNPDAILREGDALYNALNYRVWRKSVQIGYAGRGTGKRHPRSKKTIRELASIHARGGGKLPQRIIVPDVSTSQDRSMVRTMSKVVREVLAKNK